MPDDRDSDLFNHTSGSYDGSFKADLLEQYKLYVQSAENVSARRVSTVRYLLTVNAAIVALYGFQAANLDQIYLLIPVATAGLVVSVISHLIVRSYRNLNTLKFRVIHEIEQHLPLALYDYEWQIVERGHGSVYRPVSHIELWIPIVFLVLHISALAYAVIWTGLSIQG